MEKPSAWSRLPRQLRSDADHGCEVEFVAGRRRPRRWRTPTVIDGIAPENQVRTGLPAGGRWIRTIGPRHERAGFCCGRRIAGPNGGSQKGCFLCGTDSSNPSPSSGESATNPARATPVSGARGRASRGGIYLSKTWRTRRVCYIILLRLSTSPSDNRLRGPAALRTSARMPASHLVPLACRGPDTIANLQWQTIEAAKAKDRWERKACAR